MNFAALPHAVYRTPMGELCQWVAPAGYRGNEPPYATFRYVRPDQKLQDGFCLTPPNFALLRRVTLG